MRKKSKVIAIILASLVTCVLVGGFWPVNGYIESPGGADDLSQFVRIDNKQDTQRGAYRITSVYLSEANGFSYLKSKISPHESFEKASDITGGESTENFDKVQNFYMQSAIANAQIVAFKQAHKTIKATYRGIYVLSVSKTSNFKNRIRIGDTITAIDGHHYTNSDGFIKYLANKDKNKKVTVTYQRNNKLGNTSGKTMKLPGTKTKEFPNGRTGIGIVLTDNVSIKTVPSVKVDAGQIGGPSGGLMFSLQIYDQLTNQNLRKDRNISGSGTISSEGYVGEIGGIDKKVIAANAAGSKVFFAPYIKPSRALLKLEEQHKTNYMLARDTAKKYAPNMKVVPVETFQDALNYLKTGKVIQTTDKVQ